MYNNMEVIKMDTMIAIRVNEKEKQMISGVSSLNNLKVSSWIKKIIFENIENDYDIKLVEEYESEKKKGLIKTQPIENLFNELGI